MSRKIAHIVRTGRRIAPFDDPVGEALIKQKPLAEHQREVLSELGYEVRHISAGEAISGDSHSSLLLHDDLYFNAATIREFVRVARDSPASSQCAIAKDTAFARIFTPLQDKESPHWTRFPLFHLRGNDLSRCDVKVIDIHEHQVPIHVPPHMRGPTDPIVPLTTTPLVQITHAYDIIFANVACLNVRFAELLGSPTRKLLSVIRARSAHPARVLSTLNKIGRNCDIHPTAYLEGAEIGSGVHIGANAVVRMSSIGDGCNIGDGSVVKHSVVGEGSVLFDDLTLGFAVCYPETFLIHGPYHLSLFGRSSAMFATILDDFRLDGQPIRVEIDGQLVAYPFAFIGSIIGHRTRVAGGSIISPGRILPNDILIFPSPGAVLTRIPRDVPRGVPLFVHDGTLKEASDPSLKIEQVKHKQERSSSENLWTVYKSVRTGGD
jgi:carbonic anhydrase/acetyltransferase-like protein (isoleucine patch superfamily)